MTWLGVLFSNKKSMRWKSLFKTTIENEFMKVDTVFYDEKCYRGLSLNSHLRTKSQQQSPLSRRVEEELIIWCYSLGSTFFYVKYHIIPWRTIHKSQKSFHSMATYIGLNVTCCLIYSPNVPRYDNFWTVIIAFSGGGQANDAGQDLTICSRRGHDFRTWEVVEFHNLSVASSGLNHVPVTSWILGSTPMCLLLARWLMHELPPQRVLGVD